jgi:sialic acid synthase SpsE
MNKKIQIVAEIGWNFLGDLDLACEMISSASESGADYVKFQFWNENNLKEGEWDNDGRREIYKKAQLTIEKYNKLRDFAQSKKIQCFTSVFSLPDMNIIHSNGDQIIKIPSHEAYNIQMIEEALSKFDKVLLSVGAISLKELNQIEKFKNFENLVVLHCVSSYPLIANNVNLPKISYLQNIYQNVGYSGHYDGIDDAVMAMMMGAQIIEKHFSLDKNLPGRDNKFALMPHDLKKLCSFRDNLLLMNEDKGLDVQESELGIIKNYRGRWAN